VEKADVEKPEVTKVEEVKVKKESPEEIAGKDIPDLLEEFLRSTFTRLVDLVGSIQLKDTTAEVHSKCKPFFPSLDSFVFEVVPEIKIDLKKYENQWTEKETLGVAVFLETIIKSCQSRVYGMSYLNLEKLAGENSGQLKEISFFDYMDHAKEFKL
jgi:hypothetical protein